MLSVKPSSAWANHRNGLADLARRLDAPTYVVFSAVLTLAVARAFYGYMLVQTGGEWSAPLDDVFIHFDYARATARGYPFQWSPGNGYSSGNTSVLYPFVLALGYGMGFHGQRLMVWAGIVACVSVFVFLLGAAHIFRPLPRWAKYLAPPASFAVGALDWSLWSGMEVALFLGVWACALRAALRAVRATQIGVPGVAAAHRAMWALGGWSVLLVATRPEAATAVAALALFVGHAVWRSRVGGLRPAIIAMTRAGLPAVGALALQAIANRVLTGEFAASGAVVKLTAYSPYMTFSEKLADYTFLLKYVVFRNTEYHFSDAVPYGYAVPLLAAVPLFSARTRALAVTLWSSVLAWLAVVAMNAQVRWQNERYTMPAVAWLLLLAALGVALLLDPRRSEQPWPATRRWLYAGRLAGAVALVALFALHQEPRMRDQIWFFGRASRNIRDQHVTAGRILGAMSPRPRRVLVGDAGALLYASDLPGLDLIGLGGFRDLPFARAGIHGLGATLELVERIPSSERPDVFAIYPSWWGDLPSWFGRRITAVPVRGNVICGGYEKVIYRADWTALDVGAEPATLQDDERVTDEVDVADLVSERAHGYAFPHPSAGFVEAKVLPSGEALPRDMFDAGRRIPAATSERFTLHVRATKAVRLIVRTAPEHDVDIEVNVLGHAAGELHFAKADGWREASLELPAALVATQDAKDGALPAGTALDITFTPKGSSGWVDHHVWAVQAR